MLDIEDVLLGIQAGERRRPDVPPALRQVAFSETVIDSRLATPGCLFVALRGERVDGHDFLADATARGARGALVRRDRVAGVRLGRPHAVVDPATGAGLEGATPESVLLFAVDEPLQALHRLAAYHRSRFTLHVIGITGSVGKTSTKEVTAAVLQRGLRTLKNPRSYNSEHTLPIVLLQLDSTYEAAVLEMGMYGPGEIALLCSLARPQIGIVTNVGPSHLERMGSLEAIQQAKSELVRALPADGYAILNADDPRVRAMAEVTPARPFLYGLDPSADLWADAIESRGLQGISFRAHYAGEEVQLNLPLIGRHSVHTALAATAAGLLLGLGWDAIVAGLRDSSAQLRLLAAPAINGATIIDDTYNASPASSLAALNLLAELDGRRIAVLGDMLELGSVEEQAHRLVGARVAEVAQHLVTVGARARWIAEEAAACGLPPMRIRQVASNQEAVALLRELIQPGDYVLIKGSRAMGMEAIVAALQRPAP
ncbi:MAG TPA: UDP-N-acetylmuramoyl-tripeptide--D-alanyl-D-alanine ligase [Roseiflexaceae bacterium]|nr:UDP-N-acetylmuramoyl-tripeptide--D-alanyl-D-alanine ligase [Roseiflexaceae bacterium]